MEMFSLKGKKALVTGARTGIGQAIAAGLAEAGADLVLLGHQKNMEDTEAIVKSKGRSFLTVIGDLSKPEKASGLAKEILTQTDIDIVVNNAGIIRREPAIKFSKESWEDVLNTNLHSLFYFTQPFAEKMLDNREGKIINIASLLSFQGGITVPSYTASKHAVAGLTKAWANEWAEYGVQVNAIAPGYIATNNTKNLQENKERNAAILSRIPAARWGDASDIAGAAVFLSSGASNYVNGHVLVVDGGWMAR